MAEEKKTLEDPFAEREALKYEKPVPSREFILNWLTEIGKPCSYKAMYTAFGLDDPDAEEGLRRRLKAMLRDGQLLKNRRGAYAVAERLQMVPGYVEAHKDGYGFVIPDDGTEDIFLNARQMRSLFSGDRILVRVVQADNRGRLEGQLVEILERNTQRIVGRFMQEGGMAYVQPDSKVITRSILIPPDSVANATLGQIVVVDIISYPEENRPAFGKITEILGEHMAPGMEIDIAIRSHQLPHEWNSSVLNEIANLTPTVNPNDAKQRVDLRHLALVTIDGEDAKDFDDAVFCEKTKTGWKLYVAIADVSHYVQPNTALDKEAQNRGNSVYFPGRVIPMLPPILSDELCSLRPHCDRLCFVAEMSVTEVGELEHYRFYEAIMHSMARLTYNEVAAWQQSPQSETSIPTKLHAPLQTLFALYKQLLTARNIRGAIDFSTVETNIVFGVNRKIEKIIPVKRNDAHRLIEECMLLANSAAAQFLLLSKIPSLYRIHEEPPVSRVQDLRDFLKEFSLALTGGEKPQAKDYLALVEKIRDRPDQRLLQTVMLRSLSQAVYSRENKGHFGLALKAYTHFTSPIRRYPDLVVHRAIKYALQAQDPAKFIYTENNIEHLGEHCSYTERRADDATRETVAWLKCEFMMAHVGEIFSGIVTAVTSFGLFVELTDFYIEGLIHVTNLPNDYYRYDAVRHQLSGERTGHAYRLGDTLKVKVARVDLEQRKIDFDCTDLTKKIVTTNKNSGKSEDLPKKKKKRNRKRK